MEKFEAVHLEEVLSIYQGEPLDPLLLKGYEAWAMDFFHKKQYISDPHIEVTLHIDITRADQNYRKSYRDIEGSSLTAYLIWNLIRAQVRHPAFRFRKLSDRWYQFENLPLFFPVASGRDSRFMDVLIPDVNRMNWEEFCVIYRQKVEEAKTGKAPFDPIPDEVWSLFNFVGNLPNLRFFSLGMHRSTSWSGRPVFYFGQRYLDNGRLKIPFYACLDHSNTDPYALDQLLRTYHRLLLT